MMRMVMIMMTMVMMMVAMVMMVMMVVMMTMVMIVMTTMSELYKIYDWDSFFLRALVSFTACFVRRTKQNGSVQIEGFCVSVCLVRVYFFILKSAE